MLSPSHRKELRQKSSSTNISPCHHYPECIATVVTTGPKGLWDGCYKKVVYLLVGTSPLVCLSLLSIKHAFWHRDNRWAKNSIGAQGTNIWKHLCSFWNILPFFVKVMLFFSFEAVPGIEPRPQGGQGYPLPLSSRCSLPPHSIYAPWRWDTHLRNSHAGMPFQVCHCSKKSPSPLRHNPSLLWVTQVTRLLSLISKSGRKSQWLQTE